MLLKWNSTKGNNTRRIRFKLRMQVITFVFNHTKTLIMLSFQSTLARKYKLSLFVDDLHLPMNCTYRKHLTGVCNIASQLLPLTTVTVGLQLTLYVVGTRFLFT